jgi:hypothetical protein
MAAKGLQKFLGVWVAPAVTVLLLIAVAWFLMWYWLGKSNDIVRVDSNLAEELSAYSGAAQHMVPGMRFGDDQFILSFSMRGPWTIRSGIYHMDIVTGERFNSYVYTYAIHMSDAYSGEDRKLANLVLQLSYNPMAQRHSGADPQLIEELRKYARRLVPKLEFSDADKQTLERLWVQYALGSTSGTRPAAGAQLIQALAYAGKNAEAASRASWEATFQEIRQLIPPDKEAQYLDAIHGRPTTVPMATRPSQ